MKAFHSVLLSISLRILSVAASGPPAVAQQEAANLFDAQNGIYVNARNQGQAWKRPVSVELINPDGTGEVSTSRRTCARDIQDRLDRVAASSVPTAHKAVRM